MIKIEIRKWHIYLARVPYTENFSKSFVRPVITVMKHGGDVIVLPTTTQLQKKYPYDIEIHLNKPSLIKVGSIQSIHQNDIITPYNNLTTNEIIYLDKDKKIEIIKKLKEIFIEE